MSLPFKRLIPVALFTMLGAGIVAALPGTPARAALPQGAAAPDFQTQAVLAGKPFGFHLADALKKGPVVLYFFPAAFTSGCTIEAHDFSDATEAFRASGATVIGLSHDPLDKLSRFSVTECRNKFAVGVASSKVISAYKVKLPLLSMSNRTSYVIAPDGKILMMYSAFSPQDHVAKALAAVQAWHRTHPAS
ncbi:peroxiredoxin [Novosphingobium terrae]|uniref:peroxiredoxin n=1 Tax=Novosphingobium terrae TaxID=2726189 RepID=UPI001F13C83C|nr:peroxiredoxin [Novosphingobium terrae]